MIVGSRADKLLGHGHGHGHVYVYDHPSTPCREGSFTVENGLGLGAPRLRCACRGIAVTTGGLTGAEQRAAPFWPTIPLHKRWRPAVVDQLSDQLGPWQRSLALVLT